MKKALLFVVLLLVGTITGIAGERSESELQDIALRQLGKSARLMGPSAVGSIKKGGIVPKCTFACGMVVGYSAEGTGTVLLSTDDRFRPVLGYTPASIGSDREMPCCFKWWIDEMNRQMSSAKETAQEASGAITEKHERAGHVVVAPMVTTKWDQGSPYNSMCPDASGGQAMTGCVATTLAQILNYNKYPTSATFTGAYTIDGKDTEYTEEVNSTYEYPYKDAYGAYSPDGNEKNILLTYYKPAEARKLGLLLRDCGYAAYMDYGADASGANIYYTTVAVVNAFSYPQEAVKCVSRMFYTDDEWYNMIYSELAKGYPLYYSGQDAESGGHAFVVHGVDADGLVAVNWGWHGVYDGYYAMDAMDGGSYSFNINQNVIIGFHPVALADDKVESQWCAPSYEISNGTGTERIMLDLTNGLYNYSTVDYTGFIYLCVEDIQDGIIKKTGLIKTEQPIEFYSGYLVKSKKCIDEEIIPLLERGHRYKIYVATQTDEEEKHGIYRKMRIKGGAVYWIMDVDAKGIPSVTSCEYDISTGITDVERKDNQMSDETYNISGSKVGKSYKGIIIKNGKKVLRK